MSVQANFLSEPYGFDILFFLVIYSWRMVARANDGKAESAIMFAKHHMNQYKSPKPYSSFDD